MKKSISDLQAIGIAILGFTLWVMADVCVKLVTATTAPSREITAINGLSGAVFLLIVIAMRGGLRQLRPHDLRKQAASALLSSVAIFSCIVALGHLPLIIFYIAVFTAPMVVAVLASVLLREHLTRGKIIAIIAGFAGVVIANDPFGTPASNMHGDWIGFAAIAANVLVFAGLIVLLRRMESETDESITFIQLFVQTIIFGAVTLFAYVPIDIPNLLLLCLGGIFGVLGNLCAIIATRRTTAATVAQFHYTQIISGALFGYFIWHEVPTLPLFAGSTIIIASGLYIANHMRRANIAPAVKPP